jgi:hypothetical protein
MQPSLPFEDGWRMPLRGEGELSIGARARFKAGRTHCIEGWNPWCQLEGEQACISNGQTFRKGGKDIPSSLANSVISRSAFFSNWTTWVVAVDIAKCGKVDCYGEV